MGRLLAGCGSCVVNLPFAARMMKQACTATWAGYLRPCFLELEERRSLTFGGKLSTCAWAWSTRDPESFHVPLHLTDGVCLCLQAPAVHRGLSGYQCWQVSGSDCTDWLVFGNFAIVLLFLPLLFSEPDQVQALRALGHSYRLPCGKYHKWRQYYAGGSPRGRGWPGVGRTQPEAAGRHYGGMIALSVPNGLNNTEQSRSLLFSVSSLCEQIAGDMLCADQNFDIAQVIRFFRSKVRFS